jgi:hypothetical protein
LLERGGVPALLTPCVGALVDVERALVVEDIVSGFIKSVAYVGN